MTRAMHKPPRSDVRRMIAALLAVALLGIGHMTLAFEEGVDGFQPVQSSSAPVKTTTVTSSAPSAPASQAGRAVAATVESLIKLLDTLSTFFQELAKIFSGAVIPQATAAERNQPSQPTTTPSNASARANLGADSAELNAWRGGRLSPDRFVRLIGPAAAESMARTGVPASVTIAQAALETGWGGSTIGDAKNLFGIKGTGPAGSVSKSTREYVNGRYVTEQASFRAYNTWSESIDDHSRLLLGSRYRPAMACKDNADQFAAQLQRCGYATDPSYASKLISIMRSHNLYQYDS